MALRLGLELAVGFADVARLTELRAASLESEKRRDDLERWARAFETDEAHGRALRLGLELAVGFLRWGRFGPQQVCVHLASAQDPCADCAADELAREAGDELARLELEAARRTRILVEINRWSLAYSEGSDPLVAAGIGEGLRLAAHYLTHGRLEGAAAAALRGAR